LGNIILNLSRFFFSSFGVSLKLIGVFFFLFEGSKPIEIPSAGNKTTASQLDWREATAPDGRKYYYNRRTKETTWKKPENFVEVTGKKKNPLNTLLLIQIQFLSN
jgi:hypothetical protein